MGSPPLVPFPKKFPREVGPTNKFPDLSNIFSQFVADLIVALSYSIKESILGRLVKIKGES